MDDFNIISLNEGRNEWCVRLINILTPCIIHGFKSIFSTAVQMCRDGNEKDKYMMTFQNLLTRIPTWTDNILEEEQINIVKISKCNYLEELITCVHIIQMKVLSAIRVSSKQKKIDINIPKLSNFIHKVYINAARKIYTNVYLFKLNDPPLQTQKNERDLEIIIQECILNTIRESIPIEELLRAYMSETSEDVLEEYKEEVIKEPPIPPPTENEEKEEKERPPVLQFEDTDKAVTVDNVVEDISAPKTIDRLEEISVMRNNQRKAEEAEEEEEDTPSPPIRFESGNDLELDIGAEVLPNEDIDLGEIEILS